ncbi:MAG: dicarboxylate/amino acid:cation symporter [Pseudomonadota bacterium]
MKLKLWQQVIIGLILGVIAGFLFPNQAESFKILGTVFIDLIKMVIVPLIFFALLDGITSMDAGHSATRVGIKGFLIYIATATFAVAIGLTVSTIFEPGVGVNLNDIAKVAVEHKDAPTVQEFLLGLIPTNIFKAFSSDNFLQIIVFSIFAGVVINMIGSKAKPVKEIIHSASLVMFKMIEIIVLLAPIGVFGFISWMVGTQGMDVLESLGKLVAIVIGACVLQYLLFGVMLLVFGKLSPIPFFKKMTTAQSIAFATSSSKAALGTAVTHVHKRMGVSEANANFILPLGSSINMDGTAIYLGICAVFFAQAYGIHLEFSQYLMLMLTCTLGSIGAAGIPSGSIIFMGMVLGSVGLPLDGIGIILGVDRILDMIRTTVNITGDAAVTVLVDRSEGMMDEKVYYADN